MGIAEAIFAPSEKELLSISLFIILHKCEFTVLADGFTNFGGIISGPVAFLMFMYFSNLFMLETSTLGILKVSVNFRFFISFLYFLMILGTSIFQFCYQINNFIIFPILSLQFSKLFSTGFLDVFFTIFT